MSFTFVHTADWQIGKPFGGFPPETATLLRAARLDGVDRIAAVATAARARHVLVAGDVFDHAKPPQRVIGQLLARLAAHRDLVWHLLPGNHDPAQPGTVWDDITRSNPSTNVRVCTKPEAVEIDPSVLLIPAPLHAKAMSDDPTAFMDQVPSAPGVLRIGMAHGSVRGFDSTGEAAIPIAADRANSARLDYLALGDWHGLTKIDARTWYSGTHEPDGYKDNAPGHVLIVTLTAQGTMPTVRQVATNQYHWQRQALDVTSADDLAGYVETLDANPMPSARLILKLDISGRVPLAKLGALEERLAKLSAAIADLDADLSGINATTGTGDMDALGTGSIATIAHRLAAVRDTGDPMQQVAATRALRILARLAGPTA